MKYYNLARIYKNIIMYLYRYLYIYIHVHIDVNDFFRIMYRCTELFWWFFRGSHGGIGKNFPENISRCWGNNCHGPKSAKTKLFKT